MDEDRRRHARLAVSRRCKVFHRPTRQYFPATTRDVSSGGALIEIGSPRPLAAGDELDVVIDWTGKTVLPSEALSRAHVVRVADESPGASQAVAISFDRRAADALALVA